MKNFLDRTKIKRIMKSIKKLEKARERRNKAKAERIWIEENPQIHLLNYPYYKLKRKYEELFG